MTPTQQAAYDAMKAYAECESAYDRLDSADITDPYIAVLVRHGWDYKQHPLIRPWLVRRRAEALKLAAIAESEVVR